MASVKIAIIGAGSVRYSLILISDLAKTEGLSGSFVSLMDIDKERLDAIYRLAQKYTEELGVSLKIEETMDTEHALDGADFVVHTALARAEGHEDGYVQYEVMREIGEKHGYYRGIDSQEFNMVSDYYTFSNYNQLKLSLDIARAIEQICPNAWLIQTANPVFEITQLLRRQTGVKVIGFCHGYEGINDVCKVLNLDYKKVDWQVAGVNHGIWLNRFLYEGEDAYPILDEWIEEESNRWVPKDPWDMQMSPAVIDMYKFYGRIPIGDTVRNGSWKYHYDLKTKKKWFGKYGGIDNEVERPKFYDELRQMKERIIEVSKDPAVRLTVSSTWPKELYKYGKELSRVFSKDELSGEQQIPFINAVVNNEKTRLVLNVQNNGVLSDIPDDVIVEVPVWVDKNGVHPERVSPDLPERVKKFYLLPRIVRMEMALEAFTTGDRRVLEEVLIRDPRTKSYEQAKAVIDEILSLPFNRDMKEHYSYQEVT